MHSSSRKRKLFARLGSSLFEIIINFKKLDPFVFLYHSIYDDADGYLVADKWSISKNKFEHHLQIISKYYNPISITEMAGKIRNKECFAPKTVAITFDDGFNNVILHAAPLLQKYNIPWTFCVPVSCVEHGIIPWQTQLSIIKKISMTNEQLSRNIQNIFASVFKIPKKSIIEIKDIKG